MKLGQKLAGMKASADWQKAISHGKSVAKSLQTKWAVNSAAGKLTSALKKNKFKGRIGPSKEEYISSQMYKKLKNKVTGK